MASLTMICRTYWEDMYRVLDFGVFAFLSRRGGEVERTGNGTVKEDGEMGNGCGCLPGA